MDKNIAPKDRIIFPLDVPGQKEAEALVDLLKDSVGVFKIGLELFVARGPSIVEAVKKKAPSAAIFLDMKFHDIPATVKGAMGSASALGVEFITVHCDEGRGLLKAVAQGAGATKVLGVTVLTSLSGDDLVDIGIDTKRFATPEELVLHRAALAREAGCAGVVCSGLEAAAVKKRFPEMLVITPGIRAEGDSVGDQKRVVTPYEAIRNGADYIVVGRPIRNASDPVVAAKKIASDIERALKERG